MEATLGDRCACRPARPYASCLFRIAPWHRLDQGIGSIHDKKSSAIGAAGGAAAGAGIGYNWSSIRNKLSHQTADTGTQIVDQPDGSLKVSIPSQVSLDTDSATIKTAFRSVLDQVAQTIVQGPGIAARVAGHTNSSGNPDRNMALSQRRAQSVEASLVDHGVAKERLIAEGPGQTQPVASNAAEEGRVQNRRVEIYLRPLRATR